MASQDKDKMADTPQSWCSLSPSLRQWKQWQTNPQKSRLFCTVPPASGPLHSGGSIPCDTTALDHSAGLSWGLAQVLSCHCFSQLRFSSVCHLGLHSSSDGKGWERYGQQRVKHRVQESTVLVPAAFLRKKWNKMSLTRYTHFSSPEATRCSWYRMATWPYPQCLRIHSLLSTHEQN